MEQLTSYLWNARSFFQTEIPEVSSLVDQMLLLQMVREALPSSGRMMVLDKGNGCQLLTEFFQNHHAF